MTYEPKKKVIFKKKYRSFGSRKDQI